MQSIEVMTIINLKMNTVHCVLWIILQQDKFWAECNSITIVKTFILTISRGTAHYRCKGNLLWTLLSATVTTFWMIATWYLRPGSNCKRWCIFCVSTKLCWEINGFPFPSLCAMVSSPDFAWKWYNISRNRSSGAHLIWCAPSLLCCWFWRRLFCWPQWQSASVLRTLQIAHRVNWTGTSHSACRAGLDNWWTKQPTRVSSVRLDGSRLSRARQRVDVRPAHMVIFQMHRACRAQNLRCPHVMDQVAIVKTIASWTTQKIWR